MRAHVNLQVCLPSKCLPTILTFERLFFGMNTCVNGEMRLRSEDLEAKAARRRRLGGVHANGGLCAI